MSTTDPLDEWKKRKTREQHSKHSNKTSAQSFLAVWNTTSDNPKFNLKDYRQGKYDSDLQLCYEKFKEKAYIPTAKPDEANLFLSNYVLKSNQCALLVLSISAAEGIIAMQQGKIGQYVTRIIPGEATIQDTIKQYYSRTPAKR